MAGPADHRSAERNAYPPTDFCHVEPMARGLIRFDHDVVSSVPVLIAPESQSMSACMGRVMDSLDTMLLDYAA